MRKDIANRKSSR